jgi:hypothetical protein
LNTNKNPAPVAQVIPCAFLNEMKQEKSVEQIFTTKIWVQPFIDQVLWFLCPSIAFKRIVGKWVFTSENTITIPPYIYFYYPKIS